MTGGNFRLLAGKEIVHRHDLDAPKLAVAGFVNARRRGRRERQDLHGKEAQPAGGEQVTCGTLLSRAGR